VDSGPELGLIKDQTTEHVESWSICEVYRNISITVTPSYNLDPNFKMKIKKSLVYKDRKKKKKKTKGKAKGRKRGKRAIKILPSESE